MTGRRLRVLPAWLALGLLLAGCSDDGPAPESEQRDLTLVRQAPVPGPGLPPSANAHLDHLEAEAGRQQVAAAAAATALCDAVTDLLADPGGARLEMARDRWTRAHDAWLRASVLLSALGVATDPGVDAWPAMGGYIDASAGYPSSGIVYDTTLDISPESLEEQHQLTDASEVSIGFHAIEYLLWGDPAGDPRDPADFARPAPDAQADALATRALTRRRDYLDTACAMLADTIDDHAVKAGAGSARQRVALALGGLRATLQQDLLGARLQAPAGSDVECAFSGQSDCGLAPTLESLAGMLNGEHGLAAVLRDQHPARGDSLRQATVEALTALHAGDGADGGSSDARQTLVHALAALLAELRLAHQALLQAD